MRFSGVESGREHERCEQGAVIEALEGRTMLSAGHSPSPSHHLRHHADPHVTAKPVSLHVRPLATTAAAPYTPTQIRHAYGFDKISGDGDRPDDCHRRCL